MRIVFFGTPQFACTILNYLIDQHVTVAAIVTRPDKPRGRSGRPASSPVKDLALLKNLLLYQPDKASDLEFCEILKSLDADFFIVAAYAEIFKENLLEIPRYGCINVHGSILPKYRGAAPVQRAIMAGEEETGVTIMKMALQMDTGDILAIRKTEISPEMTAGELMDVLAHLGKEALWEVMQKFSQGAIVPLKQSSTLATYAKKIRPPDACVIWSLPVEKVYNQIRGVTPNPGAWCYIKINGVKKRLLIKKAFFCSMIEGKPGEICSTHPSELIVACEKGAIRLLEIQLEGKKSLSIERFLQGTSKENLCF